MGLPAPPTLHPWEAADSQWMVNRHPLQLLPLLPSFHEMAMYDVPAMVSFILQHTAQEKLYYVGHAQGNSLGEW